MLERCIGIVLDLIDFSRLASLAVVVVLRVFLISFVFVFFISVIEPLIVIYGSLDLFKFSFSFLLYIVNETASDFISLPVVESLNPFVAFSVLLTAMKNFKYC
jgi:hypothetical protein